MHIESGHSERALESKKTLFSSDRVTSTNSRWCPAIYQSSIPSTERGVGLVANVAKQRVEEKKTNTTCFSSWSLWEERYGKLGSVRSRFLDTL